MKNLFLVLVSILISGSAFAGDQSSPPSCETLRKGQVHFKITKYSWSTHDNITGTHQELVCEQTVDLNVTKITDQCDSVIPMTPVARCPVILNNIPTTVSLHADINVFQTSYTPTGKYFFASYYVGNDVTPTSFHQTSMNTKDLSLKDATLYVDAEQIFLPHNNDVIPDDLALEVTFEDPNAK